MSIALADPSASSSISSLPSPLLPLRPSAVGTVAIVPQAQVAAAKNDDGGDHDATHTANAAGPAAAAAAIPSSGGSISPEEGSPSSEGDDVGITSLNDANDGKLSCSSRDDRDCIRDGAVRAAQHPTRNESPSPHLGCDYATKDAAPELCSMYTGCDAGEDGQGEHTANDVTSKLNRDSSQVGCTDAAMMGDYSKKCDDTLVEDTGLLNNFVCSSAATASFGEEEAAQSDDAQSNHAPEEPERHDAIMEDGASTGMEKGNKGGAATVPQEEALPEGEHSTGTVSTNTRIGNSFAVALQRSPCEKKNTDSIDYIVEDGSHSYMLNNLSSKEEAGVTREILPEEVVSTPNGMGSNNSQDVETQLPPLNAASQEMTSNLPYSDKTDSSSPSSNFYSTITSSEETRKSIDEIQSRNSFMSTDSYPLTVASSPSSEGSPRTMMQHSGKKNKKKDRSGHPKLNQVAVEYLRAWMLSRQHIEQPYPTDYVYSQLGVATGLEKNQLKNWFVNNRRRLWKPMMTELRQRHGLSERDALPTKVLETLEDEPRPPYPPHVYRPANAAPFPQSASGRLLPDAPISAAADSVAAAAMIMMTGGSRVNSPTTVESPKDVKDIVKEKELEPVTAIEVKSSPSDESLRDDLKCIPTKRKYYTFAPHGTHDNKPPKEQVKFNVGGTVVQVPTDILLKHGDSKIASMARSAMRVGDVAIPIPRDYELFSHCVFYLCNDRVDLPPNVRRKAFMREMKHFGIPYEVGSISGGSASPFNAMDMSSSKLRFQGQRDQISPTNVTELHASVAGASTSSQLAPHVVLSNGSFQQQAGATATKLASPLDLLSSVSSTSSWSSGYVNIRNGAALPQQHQHTVTNTPSPNLKRSMCGSCEACLRENCGQCTPCLDKPKFGGPNKLRKKCIKRKCPNMAPHSFIGPTNKSAIAAAAKISKAAIGKLDKSFPEERKVQRFPAPNLAILAAEKRWTENLAALRPCIELGGVINYAAIEDEDTRNRVKNFVKEQRKSYRRRENGEPTSITDERLKLLEEVKFPFVFRPYTKPSKPGSTPPVAATALEESAKKPISSLDLLISITSQSIGPAIGALEEPVKKPTSLDLLCSITAKSFDLADVWSDNAIGNEDAQENNRPPTLAPSVASEITPVSGCSKSKVPRARGPNCGRCVACLREDCGECKACLDKPKFGGPNTMKRRCFNRYCISRKQDERPPQERRVSDSKSYSDAVMKLELAKIKAELEAKAQGMEFGFKIEGIHESKSSRAIENSLKESDESDREDEVTESFGPEDKVVADVNKSSPLKFAVSDEPHHAVYKAAIATDTQELPRGVTMRPSGKWQVQLYYAGNSRYIGLFDTRQEAAMAYELARECCYSFKENDPTPEQVKRNLNVMRKAAFSGLECRRNCSEESRPDDQQKKSTGMTHEGNEKRSTAVPVKCLTGNDDAMAKSKLAKTKAESSAKTRGPTRVSAKAAKVTIRSQSRRIVEKSQKTKKKVEDKTRDVVNDDAESRKRKFSSEIYKKAKALADTLPRGITVRPSGKWQVQLYYAGKSRYIGVFDSKLDAAVAYELARECFSSFKNGDPSPEQAKKNVELMRTAAFSYSQNNDKTQKADIDCDKLRKRNEPVMEQTRAARPAQRTRKLDHKKSEPKKKAMSPKPTIEFDTRKRRSNEGGMLAENKRAKRTSTMTPPTSEHFRSFEEAETSTAYEHAAQDGDQVAPSSDQASCPFPDEELSSDVGLSSSSDGAVIGSVGYKFRKKFTGEHGEDLGLYDGEVVDILSGTEKDRKCFYAADGYIEDLSLAELKELAELESKSHTLPEFGSIGWKFQKDEVKHNDLCETCGNAGELICCSTCRLVFHLGCTRPKLKDFPADDWSCPFCIASGDVVKNASKQEQQSAHLAVREIGGLKEVVRKKEYSRRKSPRKRRRPSC